MIDAQRTLDQIALDEELRDRRAALYWAAVLCTCQPTWVRPKLNEPPSFAACVIHGKVLLNHRTGAVVA